MYYWAVLFLVEFSGLTTEKATLGSLVFPVFGGFGSVLIGWLIDRYPGENRRNFILLGFLSIGAFGFFLLWICTDLNLLISGDKVLPISLLAITGFGVLAAYSLPAGTLSILFGKEQCATVSGLTIDCFLVLDFRSLWL